ncbi:hypothetical protein COO60DRAFT_672690 [Scenedesmus sp. NREL 46B-D3]|nr:hypothetical protein COO60DRAFT_672690 [Scenedesmus sp. NREL 46B-D3]
MWGMSLPAHWSASGCRSSMPTSASAAGVASEAAAAAASTAAAVAPAPGTACSATAYVLPRQAGRRQAAVATAAASPRTPAARASVASTASCRTWSGKLCSNCSGAAPLLTAPDLRGSSQAARCCTTALPETRRRRRDWSWRTRSTAASAAGPATTLRRPRTTSVLPTSMLAAACSRGVKHCASSGHAAMTVMQYSGVQLTMRIVPHSCCSCCSGGCCGCAPAHCWITYATVFLLATCVRPLESSCSNPCGAAPRVWATWCQCQSMLLPGRPTRPAPALLLLHTAACMPASLGMLAASQRCQEPCPTPASAHCVVQ